MDKGKLLPTTTAEDDGIENGWLLLLGTEDDETTADDVEPAAAIETTDTDEADETGGEGGVELRTSDKEVAWPKINKETITRFRTVSVDRPAKCIYQHYR